MIFFFISVATFLVQCSADASHQPAAYAQDRFTPGGGILSIP